MINKQEFLDTYGYFDKQVLIEIIDIFMDEFPGRIEKLLQEATEKNFPDLRFDAHWLKGTVANFCAPVAKEKAYELEKLASWFIDNKGEGYNETEVLKKVQDLHECVLIMAGQLKEMREEFVMCK